MKPFTAPTWNAHATFATSFLGILRDFGDPAAQKNVGPGFTGGKKVKQKEKCTQIGQKANAKANVTE